MPARLPIIGNELATIFWLTHWQATIQIEIKHTHTHTHQRERTIAKGSERERVEGGGQAAQRKRKRMLQRAKRAKGNGNCNCQSLQANNVAQGQLATPSQRTRPSCNWQSKRVLCAKGRTKRGCPRRLGGEGGGQTAKMQSNARPANFAWAWHSRCSAKRGGTVLCKNVSVTLKVQKTKHGNTTQCDRVATLLRAHTKLCKSKWILRGGTVTAVNMCTEFARPPLCHAYSQWHSLHCNCFLSLPELPKRFAADCGEKLSSISCFRRIFH